MNRLDLRIAAIPAGIKIEHGIVTSKWFGEQRILTVRDWSATDDYIPYLSVASSESTHLHEHAAGQTLPNANRMTQHVKTYLDISFSPEEDPSGQSVLMDLCFNCITQLHPCENEADILPAGLNLLHEQLSLPTR